MILNIEFCLQGEFNQGPDWKPYWQKETIYSDKPLTTREVERIIKQDYEQQIGRENYYLKQLRIVGMTNENP